MKCRYGHCKHDSKDIPDGEAVHVGNAYYHQDCYREKQSIDDIIAVWCERVDDKPIYGELRGVINNLIFKTGYPAEKVLWYLRWATTHGIGIKHPPGLYWLMKNEKIAKAWEDAQKKTIADNWEFELANTEAPSGFEYKPQTTGFKRIIKR